MSDTGTASIFGQLLSDGEATEAFSDASAIRAMIAFEAALARAQARLGIVPKEAAAAITRAATRFVPDIAAIGAGTAASGVPVIELVNQFRAAIDGDAADHVHWGATSQDVVDTALVMRLAGVLDLLSDRLDRLIGLLGGLADRHRHTVMAARTRSQQAMPTTFGLKTALWLAPLLTHRETMRALRARVLVVQFGGAAGTLAALGNRGVATMEELARELGLGIPAAPWHSRRENFAELAGWLSLVTGSLGKMGQDLVLLAQSEVAELRPGAGGGSSTMPQKSNPVTVEILVSLARMNATLLPGMHEAMIQEHERGGSGWTLEWMILPRMAVNTATSLRHAVETVETLAVDSARMRRNLDASNGLLLAEAMSFALAAHMPRAEARTLVATACKAVAATGLPLAEILSQTVDAPVDWKSLSDPANYLGEAETLIDRILAQI